MPAGITTTVGRVPIPFAGFGSYGSTGAKWIPSRRPTFAGSSELVSIANQALSRLQNAIDTANAACEGQSGYGQAIFNWITSNTSTETICNAAYNMQVAYDDYYARVNDPNTTDDQLAEILAFIKKNIDIHDLIETANATNVLTVMGKAILGVPGTIIGGAASGVEQIGKGIFGAIPWWGWALGAAYIATQLGWKPLETFKR